MKHVVILGAGFSRAISDHMPLTDGLGTEVVGRLGSAVRMRAPDVFSGGRFETWLSRLAEAQPDLSDADNLENRATFLRIAQYIREVLRDAQQRALSEPLKWEIQRLVGVFHKNRSIVVTFKYDTLLERAITVPHRINWPGSGIAKGLNLVRDRPLPPGRGGMFGPDQVESFQLLKLHGSIDTYWVADDQTGATISRLPLDGEWWSVLPEDIGVRQVLLPGRVPFIVPPAAAKSAFYTNPLSRQLWYEASVAISSASQVDIVGYSLPLTDLVTSGMLADALAPSDSAVRVINPSPSGVVRRLRDLGVAGDRITEIGGDDCMLEYAEILEREIDLFATGESGEHIKFAVEQKCPILVATSESNAAPVIAVELVDDDPSVLNIVAGPVANINQVAEAGVRQDGVNQVHADQIFGYGSKVTRLVVTFQHGEIAHITEVARWGMGTLNWLVLVPSTMPSGARIS